MESMKRNEIQQLRLAKWKEFPSPALFRFLELQDI
jgi:hypothetical protein